MTNPFTKIVTENGMRIILVPQPSNVATTILVMVEAGSKYETKEINGLSHFLEHMCFKGTTKRPKAIDIAGELDGLGAEYNAFTGHEWTGYFVKVEARKAEQALEIITDLYLNPVFDAAEIEKEKGVIIEEINMYEDLPPRKVGDLFTSLLYGDQPAGWNIAGEKDIIRKLTREDFLKYRGAHYVAKATAIIVAGAFDEQAVQEHIKRHFVTLRVGEKAGKIPTTESQTAPALKIQPKESDQTHLIIGCRAFGITDPRRYALDLLADILGGGMSSRLFQRVREEMGAAYYVRASTDLFTDHGYFAVAAGVDHAKFKSVVQAILEELEKTAMTAIPLSELKRAKEHLIGRLLLGIETSDEMAMYYGGQEVLREAITTPAELMEKIQAITIQDIQEVAQFVFRNEKLNMALIGPIVEEEIAKEFRFRG